MCDEKKIPAILPGCDFIFKHRWFARAAQCEKLCSIDFWQNASLAQVKNALARVDVNARNKDGLAPLHSAALINKSPEIVDLLLAHGADVRAKTKGGETAFDLVKKNKNLQNTDAYRQLHDAQYQ